MDVTFAPNQLTTDVKSVEVNHVSVDEAIPGNLVGFKIKNPVLEIKCGHVASDSKNKPACGVKDFTALVIVLHHPGQVSNIISWTNSQYNIHQFFSPYSITRYLGKL